jgi:hypothetical protein
MGASVIFMPTNTEAKPAGRYREFFINHVTHEMTRNKKPVFFRVFGVFRG